MTDLRAKLQELLDLEDGLTEWEIEFLDFCHNWSGCFTTKMAKRLEEIHDKRIG